MIRVLQVVNIMDRAGLETMLMNYYRNIDRSQLQFDFLTHRDTPGAYENEIKELGGKIYRAPRLYPQNYLRYFSFLSKFFSEHQEYKIVHSHIDTMSAFPLYAAKRAGIPNRIGHSHSSKLDLDFKLPIKYAAKLLMPYEANWYFACSQKAADFMYPRKKVKIIHNAIDLAKFQYDDHKRNDIRNKLNLNGKFVIGHVGRFYYVKNQMFLLEIVNEIKKENANIRLLLIGKGEDAGMTLSEFAAQMLMKGRVNTSYVFYVHPDEIEAITREFAAIGNNLNQIAAFFNSGGLPSHVMCKNINHAIACIFEMREQVAEMAGKNYGNLKAHRK